jgi:amidophosphoribosyltransferase
MKVLLGRIREQGRAREIHVRVACPPIIAPCFYGIDMSTIGELFAPPFLRDGQLTEAAQQEMAERLGADSLRYLPVESIADRIAQVPTRQNSPSDVEIDAATRDFNNHTLTFSTALLNRSLGSTTESRPRVEFLEASRNKTCRTFR